MIITLISVAYGSEQQRILLLALIVSCVGSVRVAYCVYCNFEVVFEKMISRSIFIVRWRAGSTRVIVRKENSYVGLQKSKQWNIETELLQTRHLLEYEIFSCVFTLNNKITKRLKSPFYFEHSTHRRHLDDKY